MMSNEAMKLIEPGYSPLETGFCDLPNGEILVSVLTRMKDCDHHMVDWWFGYLDGSEKYRQWYPAGHLELEWDEHWTPGSYIGASFIAEQNIDGANTKNRFHFHQPSDFMNGQYLINPSRETFICANVYDLDKIPQYKQVHYIRNTPFGCEVKSRIWLDKAKSDLALPLMHHCIAEMGMLADILPGEYPE